MKKAKQPNSVAELKKMIAEIIPTASVEEDNYGQIIIYTGLQERIGDPGEVWLEPFDEDS